VDGTEKFIYPNGEEETIFHDGTIQKIGKDKIKTIQYPNGSKDTVYPDGQRVRVFADGRIKKLD
jgi:hypothetical protein